MSEIMQSRKGIPMTEAEVKEWEQAFKDIEESIDGIDEEDCPNPEYRKYLKMKQQELF